MPAPPAQSVAQVVQRLAAALDEVAPGASWLEAEVLVRHVLKWDRPTWLVRLRDPAPVGLDAMLAPLVARRLACEPIAYLTERREFFGREFRVGPGVLIPRPETELVAAEALQAIARQSGHSDRPLRVADVGTGSGCLAVTLALEAPCTLITATDVSADALDIARSNAARWQVGSRIEWRLASLLDNADETFDVIVSNPPYVAETDRADLMADVRQYEPEVALFGGRDGLDVIRDLLPAAARALVPGGCLVMEIGATQAEAVASLLRTLPRFGHFHIREDLAGRPRVVIAQVNVSA